MFRNPRENLARNVEEQVLPSIGRAPTPEREKSLVRSKPVMATGTKPLVTPSKKVPVLGVIPQTRISTAKKNQVKQNHSILNFFGKAPVNPAPQPEISATSTDLFFEATPTKIEHTSPEPQVSNDDSPIWAGWSQDDPIEALRYNESEEPSKRRKLAQNDSPSKQVHHGVTVKMAKLAPKSRGGFIDDSSDEEEMLEDIPARASNVTETGENVEAVEISNPIQQEKQYSETVETTIVPVKTGEEDSGQRSVERPPLNRQGTSGFQVDEFGPNDFDDEFFPDGEEYMERQYMAEQMEMEREFEDDSKSESDTDGARTPGADAQPEQNDTPPPECPICNGPMPDMSETEISRHVNACLDGTAKPLPKMEELLATKRAAQSTGFAPKPQSNRISRAAVARPGQANPFSASSSTTSPAETKTWGFMMQGRRKETNAWSQAAKNEIESRGKPAYERTCPFYKIMPGFDICVDAFRYGKVKGQQAYFLSHFHSDHYIGMTSRWQHGPVYASKVSCNLMKQQLGVHPEWVRPLEFEKRTELPEVPGVYVTMIPANHCPGSSIFLFEKITSRNKDGPVWTRILHCGDFRACPAHIHHPLLRPEVMDAVSGQIKDQKIDICYLDTTYLTPKYSFPSQSDVIAACAEMCLSLSKDIPDKEDAWEQVKLQRGASTLNKYFSKGSKSEEIKEETQDGVQDEKDFDSENEDNDFEHGEIEDMPELDADESVVPGDSIEDQKLVEEFLANEASIKQEPCDDQVVSDMVKSENATDEKRRGRLLVVVGTYSIGKERICMGIARALKSKIYAPPQKMKICRALEDDELNSFLTNNPYEAQVHMQMLMEIRAETLFDYLVAFKSHFSRVVGFRPTGWSYKPPKSRFTDNPPVEMVLHSDTWKSPFTLKNLAPQRGSNKHSNCFGVPYSEHSSFRELTMFCCALNIGRIIPTVNVGSARSREKMQMWIDKWAAEKKKSGLFKVPEDDIERGWGSGDGKLRYGV